MTATTWWWVRHAPVVEMAGLLYGQMDLAADVLDQAAFAALAAKLPQEALWITSPLKRTRQTFDAIQAARGSNAEPDLVEPDLIEQGFGDWQGQSYQDIRASTDPALWASPGTAEPPGGESFAAVIERVRPAIERLNAEHAGRHIVAVVHGGSIRAALAAALELSPDKALALVIDNLSISRLEAIDDPTIPLAWRVHYVNFVAG
jgi:alpha-ribazole phosphatase